MKTLLLLFVIAFGVQQSTEPKTLIAGEFSSFTSDELGNIYVLKKDEIELYRSSGEFWMRNSIKTIGKIHSMDVFYSLKPMLFSQELQQLAVLDNTLSIQGDLVWLSRRGYPQVSLVASSVQNHFWLYDQLDMQLIRVNQQWEKVSDSGRIDQLLNLTPEPSEIVEYDNWVYVNDPQNGILVFDLFGNYAKTIPIREAYSVQVRNNGIYYLQHGKAFSYDMIHFRIKEIALPGVDHKHMRVEQNRILYLGDTGIQVFVP